MGTYDLFSANHGFANKQLHLQCVLPFELENAHLLSESKRRQFFRRFYAVSCYWLPYLGPIFVDMTIFQASFIYLLSLISSRSVTKLLQTKD